jgi:hypothetical protein
MTHLAAAPPAAPMGTMYGPAGQVWTKLYVADMAVVAGVLPQTILQYNWDAGRRRKAGKPRPRDLPEPDDHEPNPKGGPPLPIWFPGTAARWLAVRQVAGHPPADGGKTQRRTENPGKTGPKPRQPAA